MKYFFEDKIFFPTIFSPIFVLIPIRQIEIYLSRSLLQTLQNKRGVVLLKFRAKEKIRSTIM